MSDTLMDKLGFSEKTQPIPQQVDVEVQEVNMNAQEVHDTARSSLDFLAALALPTIFRYFFPDTYLKIWEWLLSFVHKERDFSQLALGLPRGFAKTTFIKIFLLYCILFTKKKFLLVCAENQGKGENIIADVIDMLNVLNIKRVFGDWRLGIEKETQDIKKFGFRGRDITLVASTVPKVRGLNLKNERPDVMIFEDIQSREMAESQIQSETLEREMIGTAMKAKSPHGCLFIFVGNMYPTKYSILRKLKTNPNWVKFIAGGILEDGSSLWEDLQPVDQLMKELANDLAAGHPEIFFAEVLNDENASVNNLIDLSKLPLYPFQDNDIPAGNFILIDPSTDKNNADAVSVGYFEVHNATPVLRKLKEGRMSPGDTIRTALDFCLTMNCRLVVIESNAYQYTLKYWSEFICQQMGIEGIEFVEIYSGALSKVSRIFTMIKAYAKAEFYVHPDCTAPVHLQLTQFNPLRKDNVDGLLDLLSYCTRVLEMYGQYVVSINVIESQEWAQLKVPVFNSSF